MKIKFLLIFVFSLFYSASSFAQNSTFDSLFETTVFSTGTWKEFREEMMAADKLKILCDGQKGITMEAGDYKFIISEARGSVQKSVKRRKGGYFQDAEKERIHGYVFEALEPHRHKCNAQKLTAEVKSARERHQGLANTLLDLIPGRRGGDTSSQQ